MDRRKRLVWGLSVNYVSLQKVDIEPAFIKRLVTNALKLKQQKKKKKNENQDYVTCEQCLEMHS